MTKLSTDQLVDAFKDMTLPDLADFRSKFEETFDVSGEIAPVIIHDEFPVEEETQTQFDVILESAGGNKIPVIKVAREITKLGLKDAKDLVDDAPRKVLEAAGRDDAENAAERLRAVGATVTVS